jgi:hypothetical protein
MLRGILVVSAGLLVVTVSACGKKVKYGPNTVVVHPAPDTFELCVVANDQDDAAVCQLAKEWFEAAQNNGDRSLDLRRRAERGEPPPAPMAPQGTSFEALGLACTYRWAPISKLHLKPLGLDPRPKSADDFGVKRYIEIGKARNAGLPYVEEWYGGEEQGSRMFWSRVRPGPSNAPVETDYFLLVRVEPDIDRVRGEEMTIKWDPDQKNNGYFFLHGELDDAGREKFTRLTTRNRPGQSGKAGFHRELAIVIRGEIVMAPVIREPITKGEVQIGPVQRDEADELIKALAGN